MSTDARIRCDQCGALASPGAEWCQQCYARLTGAAAASPTPAGRHAGPPAEVPAPPMPVAPRAPRNLDGIPTVMASTDAHTGAGADLERPAEPHGPQNPSTLLAALWELPTVPGPDIRRDLPVRPGHHPGAVEAGGPDPAAEPSSPAPGGPSPNGDGTTFTDGPPTDQARPSPTWPCAVCGRPNDLSRDTCSVCGASFSKLFEQEETRPKVAPNTAVARSLMFPGLGHAAAGRKAEGLARAVLFLWCAGTALFLLTNPPARGLGILLPMAVVFVMGALVLYAATALDAFRLASGEKQLLSSRSLLYGTAGLMMLSVGSLFLMVTRAGHLQ
ncbi:MAG TPA: hypothetical protein VGB19_08850 [Actinomycetota bacterium]